MLIHSVLLRLSLFILLPSLCVGNIIITALGFVPGYYVSILSIEYLGRKWIQIQGFLMAALFRESPCLRLCVMRKREPPPDRPA